MNAVTRSVLAAAAAGVALACNEPVGAGYTPPDPVLTGGWGSTPVPSGSFVEFALAAGGGSITGAGREFRAGVYYDTLSITGQYAEQTGSLVMTFTYSDGSTANYKGLALTPTQLAGTWSTGSSGSEPFDRNFFVRPQAPCADSAPLLGTPGAPPAYLVAFTSATADPAGQAARLGTLYHFTPSALYTATTPTGFAASILPTTAALLRCDSTVAFVEYNGVLSLQ